jgi:hypothetical protein
VLINVLAETFYLTIFERGAFDLFIGALLLVELDVFVINDLLTAI